MQSYVLHGSSAESSKHPGCSDAYGIKMRATSSCKTYMCFWAVYACTSQGWDPNPNDMKTVVAIHNTVNEKAWQEVCEWEAMHKDECPCGPKLSKFQGRPQDLSPRARLLNLLGYATPFDRHDWVVDRCGKKVRYIIDFYAGIPKPGGPPAAMWLDTRPALDSFEAVWDRMRVTGRWLFTNVLYRE